MAQQHHDTRPLTLAETAEKIFLKINTSKSDKETWALGVQLWNLVVKKSINFADNERNTEADIRCKIVEILSKLSNLHSSTALLQLTNMASIAGHIQGKCGSFVKAHQLFQVAKQTLSKISHHEAVSEKIRLARLRLESSTISIYGLQQNFLEAKSRLQTTLQLKNMTDNDGLNLSQLATEVGLVACENRKFTEALDWFTEARDLMCKYNGDDESMSRQLRLLAYVYEEMGLHEKALEVLDLARFESLTNTGALQKFLVLRSKLLSNGEANGDGIEEAERGSFNRLFSAIYQTVLSVYMSIFEFPDLNIQTAVNALESGVSQPRIVNIDKIISTIQHVRTSKLQRDGQFGRLEVSCIRCAVNLERKDFLDTLIESVLQREKSGTYSIAKEEIRLLHEMFWEQGNKYYVGKQIKKAKDMYSYSLSFPVHMLEEDEIASLKTNLAWCFLKLQQYSDARSTAKTVKEADLRIKYILVTCAIRNGTPEESLAALKDLASSDEDNESGLRKGLLSLVASEAFETDKHDLIVFVLQNLYSEDPSIDDLHVLRCLLRLIYSNFSTSAFTNRWKELYHIILISKKKLERREMRNERATERNRQELNWWIRICWSFGIEACNLGNVAAAVKFLEACSDLDQIRGNKETNRNRRQMCELLRVAAYTMNMTTNIIITENPQANLKNSSNVSQTEMESFQTALKKCRSFLSEEEIQKDLELPLEQMLRQYEFYVLSHIGTDEQLLSMLHSVRSSPYFVRHKVAFIMGGVAKAAMRTNVALTAFKLSLKVLEMKEVSSHEKLHCLREIVDTGLSIQLYQESLEAAQKLITLGKSSVAHYESDMEWLLTVLWNKGIENYSQGEKALAMQLCDTAMSILNILPASSAQLLKPTMVAGFQKLCGQN